MDRLIGIKQRQYARLDEMRVQEDKLAKRLTNKYRARENPFKNTDTAEQIKRFLDLEERNPKRNALFSFIAEKRFNDIMLPNSMFDAPLEQRKRIEQIIAEENKKMQSNDNDEQKFDRLKRQVEELVE